MRLRGVVTIQIFTAFASSPGRRGRWVEGSFPASEFFRLISIFRLPRLFLSPLLGSAGSLRLVSPVFQVAAGGAEGRRLFLFRCFTVLHDETSAAAQVIVLDSFHGLASWVSLSRRLFPFYPPFLFSFPSFVSDSLPPSLPPAGSR